MLWIGVCEAVCVASVGGLLGGCIMGLALKQTNKFNMNVMETYWNSDIQRIQSIIEIHSQKISTLSVAKPVSNQQNNSNYKGYKNQRQINQKG